MFMWWIIWGKIVSLSEMSTVRGDFASKLNPVILSMRNHLNLNSEKIRETLNCDHIPRGLCCSNSMARGEPAPPGSSQNPKFPWDMGMIVPAASSLQCLSWSQLWFPHGNSLCVLSSSRSFSPLGKTRIHILFVTVCLVPAADPGIRIWHRTFYQL